MLTQLILNSSQHLRLQGVSTAGKPLEKPIISYSPLPDSSDRLPSSFALSPDWWDTRGCLGKTSTLTGPHGQSAAPCPTSHRTGPNRKPLSRADTVRMELIQWRASCQLWRSHFTSENKCRWHVKSILFLTKTDGRSPPSSEFAHVLTYLRLNTPSPKLSVHTYVHVCTCTLHMYYTRKHRQSSEIHFLSLFKASSKQ